MRFYVRIATLPVFRDDVEQADSTSDSLRQSAVVSSRQQFRRGQVDDINERLVNVERRCQSPRVRLQVGDRVWKLVGEPRRQTHGRERQPFLVLSYVNKTASMVL